MNPNLPIPVLPLITQWVTLKAPEIKTIVEIPGGWELWAQTDFSILLRKNATYTETHSPPCYAATGLGTRNGKADHHICRAGYQDAIVELKVYNQVSETVEAFAQKVLEDEKKIRTRARAQGYENHAFWSIGIALASHAEQTKISKMLQATHRGSIVNGNVNAEESLTTWHNVRY